jgi:hypothetical protein
MPSSLIDDLSQVPNIIGSLGLAIAEAQKQFDLNYLNGLQTLAAIAKSILATAPPEGTRDFLEKLIQTAAPPRYQFTETTLAVKLDLSETRNWSAQAGLGFGFAGVVVNAAFAYGYSSEYRAGAEIKTTLHAILPQSNADVFKVLLDRAATLIPPALSAITPLNQQVIDAMQNVAKSVGATTTPITAAAPPAVPPAHP